MQNTSIRVALILLSHRTPYLPTTTNHSRRRGSPPDDETSGNLVQTFPRGSQTELVGKTAQVVNLCSVLDFFSAPQVCSPPGSVKSPHKFIRDEKLFSISMQRSRDSERAPGTTKVLIIHKTSVRAGQNSQGIHEYQSKCGAFTHVDETTMTHTKKSGADFGF